jgi:hypothetical protein
MSQIRPCNSYMRVSVTRFLIEYSFVFNVLALAGELQVQIANANREKA